MQGRCRLLTKNHNESNITDDSKSMAFIGRPDSAVAWIKAVPKKTTQNGRFYVMLHDNCYIQDPGTSWDKVIAVAGVNPPSSNDWVRYSCPFYYAGETQQGIENQDGERTPKLELTGNARPSYVLVTFSTNWRAGEGTEGDEIYGDDIEMIYNSKLESITIDGQKINGFSKDNYSYVVEGPYNKETFACKSDGRYATVEQSYDAVSKVLTITVKGDDYSVNPANLHTYTVTFGCKAKLNSFEIDGVALADFSADKLEYTIDRVYNNVKSKSLILHSMCIHFGGF